jgi:hypothetical protein
MWKACIVLSIAAHGVMDKYIAQRPSGSVGSPGRGDNPRQNPGAAAGPLTRWTMRRMAALVGVSHVTVARVW